MTNFIHGTNLIIMLRIFWYIKSYKIQKKVQGKSKKRDPGQPYWEPLKTITKLTTLIISVVSLV